MEVRRFGAGRGTFLRELLVVLKRRTVRDCTLIRAEFTLLGMNESWTEADKCVHFRKALSDLSKGERMVIGDGRLAKLTKSRSRREGVEQHENRFGTDILVYEGFCNKIKLLRVGDICGGGGWYL